MRINTFLRAAIISTLLIATAQAQPVASPVAACDDKRASEKQDDRKPKDDSEKKQDGPLFGRDNKERFKKFPSDSPVVQKVRESLIRGLIRQLQELAGEGGPREGDREVYLDILRLRNMLMDGVITDQEMDAAREIRRRWIR
ncbi:MAG: hypothetical protein AB1631_19905 [Acidobacteriota bacterium]